MARLGDRTTASLGSLNPSTCPVMGPLPPSITSSACIEQALAMGRRLLPRVTVEIMHTALDPPHLEQGCVGVHQAPAVPTVRPRSQRKHHRPHSGHLGHQPKPVVQQSCHRSTCMCPEHWGASRQHQDTPPAHSARQRNAPDAWKVPGGVTVRRRWSHPTQCDPGPADATSSTSAPKSRRPALASAAA